MLEVADDASIEVCPFSEMEIRTTEVWLAHEIAAMGRLPWRLQLAPMGMQAEFRRMCIERLAGKLPPEAITYPPTAGDRAQMVAAGQDPGDQRTSFWHGNSLG